jgi:hypothetical protein
VRPPLIQHLQRHHFVAKSNAGAMVHLGSFGANFAARFMEMMRPARLVVYGVPSPQLKEALAGLSPVYMPPFGGFNR